jgi:signal transduction histidine kinase
MTNKAKTVNFALIEGLLPWIVLAIIVFFTYVKFFAYPYAGFRWDSKGQVAYIFTEGNTVTPLQVGDQLLKADSIGWADFKQDLQKVFIDIHQRGDVVQLLVERNGQQIAIPWLMPGPNSGEIIDLAMTSGWFGFVFWLLGALTYFKLQPRNLRWRLMVAFNFLTAIWLTVGSGLSILHIWESGIILRVFVWISVPVYLHLHWEFPQPLARLSPRIVWSAYLASAFIVLAQIFQLIPENFYYLGFLLSIVSSIALLIAHAIRQPRSRNELRALVIVAILSFAPTIMIGVLGSFFTFPAGVMELGVISLPLLPLAYFYAALRRQFGGIELSFNRFFSNYVFAILLFTALLPVLVLLSEWITGPASAFTVGTLVLLIAVVSTVFGYNRAQTFFERHILGVSLPPQNLLELFSERITTSASFSSLKNILETEVLPNLHIKQFAFLQIENGSWQVLQAFGVDSSKLSTQNPWLLSSEASGKFRVDQIVETGESLEWVRLSLELKVSGDRVGLWLFGQRDPEDYYSQVEINLLQSLANQTAIAMSNIMQTQRVLEMYQQDIGRHEQERMMLAMDLHDSILNQMATLILSLDDQSISPAFQASYDELVTRLREIVSDLRPAMLNYGLKAALDELAESLMERSKTGLQICLDLQSSEERYPAPIEQHLYRIVQEASENAIRHGKANQVNITGTLGASEINLAIADNGCGFEAGQGFELAGLLANKHFGLAGMLERARLIGGIVKIDSSIAGTQISFRWAASALS